MSVHINNLRLQSLQTGMCDFVSQNISFIGEYNKVTI